MNETATGITNPIQEIAAMIHAKYPDVLILVDAVSCMAGIKIEFDAWGLDVCFAGTQKCFALPPGLTVCAVSERGSPARQVYPPPWSLLRLRHHGQALRKVPDPCHAGDQPDPGPEQADG